MTTLARIRRLDDLIASPVAAGYDATFRTPRCRREDRQLARLLRRFLAGTTGPVLDVGCGTGTADLPLHRYTGLDISAAMLAEARGRLAQADLFAVTVAGALDA